MTTTKKKELSEEKLNELASAIVSAEEPTLKVKKLRFGAGIAGAAKPGDAGFDLAFTPSDGVSLVLRAGTCELLETGVAVAIPEGHAGLILPRSGIASKQFLAPINTPGLIDSGYRGEVLVALFNHGQQRQVIKPGDRIAQLVVLPVAHPMVQIVSELDETERGEGGFGSTGL